MVFYTSSQESETSNLGTMSTD